MLSSLLLCPVLLPAGEGARALEQESHTRQMLAVRRLPEELSLVDQRELVQFLSQPVQGTDSDIQQHNALRNEVAVYLIRTRQQLPELARSCRDAWSREGEDTIWLDYTLQFAGSGYAVFAEADQVMMEALLWEKTSSLEENYAGTALLALSRNRTTLQKKDQWIPTLHRVLQNPKQVPANRMTALQLLTEAKDPDAAAVARDWLQSGTQTTVPQQLTALNTLSILGTEQDKALLQTYAGHPNRLLRKRAHSALTQL